MTVKVKPTEKIFCKPLSTRNILLTKILSPKWRVSA